MRVVVLFVFLKRQAMSYHEELRQLQEQFTQGLMTDREYWGKVVELACKAYEQSPE